MDYINHLCFKSYNNNIDTEYFHLKSPQANKQSQQNTNKPNRRDNATSTETNNELREKKRGEVVRGMDQQYIYTDRFIHK